jgi:hypothetical protein
MTRRTFVSGAAVGPVSAAQAPGRSSNPYAIRSQKKPVAIAMWDFSWILRHHRLGEFENWDKALDELAGRGYNAIRMDAMPHLVAPDASGRITEEYYFKKDSWKPALWGNDYSVRFRPREALLEFLPKCYARGIHAGLATWFPGPVQRFREPDGLLRAWQGTLSFLEGHGLLDRVLYVDVLNEYPMWHGFDWLKKGVEERADLKNFRASHPDVHVPDLETIGRQGRFNPLQKQFFNDFLTGLLTTLKKQWPRLDFFASLDSGMPLDAIDLSAFGALDYHIWFHHHQEMGRAGLSRISAMPNDNDFEAAYADLKRFWAGNRARMIEWMTGRIQAISAAAAKHGIPCGNTEGWGPIFWIDAPSLDWEWTKESAEICVDVALANGYKFICTSNFTHPQFRGLWEQVQWHRKMTARIRA